MFGFLYLAASVHALISSSVLLSGRWKYSDNRSSNSRAIGYCRAASPRRRKCRLCGQGDVLHEKGWLICLISSILIGCRPSHPTRWTNILPYIQPYIHTCDDSYFSCTRRIYKELPLWLTSPCRTHYLFYFYTFIVRTYMFIHYSYIYTLVYK